MIRYFVTGTDTDCGKTYATRQLMKAYPNSMAIKPIASGCHRIDHQLISSDAKELVKETDFEASQINPWRFELPVSPHIAAEQEEKSIDLIELMDFCIQFQAPGVETLFIEGAGGLMVPLNKQHTWVDFLIKSHIPVILVVGMKLGCINHASLTDAVLKACGIDCVGWIANCIDPDMLFLDENIERLKDRLHAPLIGTIPYGGCIEKLGLGP
jgi:dethiobiotin synthetase